MRTRDLSAVAFLLIVAAFLVQVSYAAIAAMERRLPSETMFGLLK